MRHPLLIYAAMAAFTAPHGSVPATSAPTGPASTDSEVRVRQLIQTLNPRTLIGPNWKP